MDSFRLILVAFILFLMSCALITLTQHVLISLSVCVRSGTWRALIIPSQRASGGGMVVVGRVFRRVVGLLYP